MRLYSTKNPSRLFSLKEAVLKGLPDDNGLFMPEKLTPLPKEFFNHLPDKTFHEIGFEVSRHLIGNSIPARELRFIIESALTFPALIVKLAEDIYILELFHGPSLAFKDFGARFMAQLMSYYNRGENKELVILVATSGDTGGAVASGFYKTPGIKVVILYPSGKVSHLQEKQLTTLGHNIAAVEIDGTFDDCQAIVKSAFLDNDITSKLRLSSANSINIARLIPQSFYYFEAFKQIKNDGLPIVFSVPSGNFGNLTAGIFAKRMGLAIDRFIAATNANRVVPEFLKTGVYRDFPSVSTLSNAMDVGNPSNFARMNDLFCSTWNNFKSEISGFSISDKNTKETMREVYTRCGYVLDPHGAVGYSALEEYKAKSKACIGVVLETAHPSKFLPAVEDILNAKVEIPARLAELKNLEKISVRLGKEYGLFKEWLLSSY